IHSGQPSVDFIDYATRHVLLRQGVLGIKVKIMLEQANGKKALPDAVLVLEPKEDDAPVTVSVQVMAPVPVAQPVEESAPAEEAFI
ncbi:40S ribosomal protein S3, partial [Nowakowskiella sp. JEL0407]